MVQLSATLLVLANTSTVILQSSIHSNIYLFIYSLKKQLLNDYHMPGIVRSTGHEGVTRLYLCLQGHHFFFHCIKAESEPLVSPSHVIPKVEACEVHWE